MTIKEHELIVLGGGTGNIVASAAADEGLDVALVERGRLGGTCLNRGCVPSKKLIHRANVIETIRNARSFGIEVSIDDVPYERFIEEVNEAVIDAAEAKAEHASNNDDVAFYQTKGQFVDEDTIKIDRDGGFEHLRSDKIVLAGGSRPRIPETIDGTTEVDFLTSDEALRLRTQPDRLIIVGGGYVAVEIGHFYNQMGTDVVIVGHGDVLVDREDRDIAERLTVAYREQHELHLGYRVTEITEDDKTKTVTARSKGTDEITVSGDELLLATGRRPNTDLWNIDTTGIKTTDDGFVETNEYLETTVDGIWAIGDIAGNYMFKHAGDKEAEYVVTNVVHDRNEPVDYPGMAHAIFGSPQLASLGKTEDELADDREYEIGVYEYTATALGSELAGDTGFAKAIVGGNDEVLGFHIVGPDAAMLIHEVSTAVGAGAQATQLAETIHVHPALSEVVQGAFRDIHPVAPSGF